MGLRDLKHPTAQVETPGGSFVVRGLSLEDLTILMKDHTEEVGTLFNQFRDWSLTPDTQEKVPVHQFLVRIVSQTPALISRVIARAADEDDAEGIRSAAKLVPEDQSQALEKIGGLTFRSEAELEKMLKLAIRSLDQLTRALISDSAGLDQPELGSGASGQ
jgi:hypothetical protein